MIDISRTVVCPCKNCPDRWIDIEARKRCHDNCEKFKKFKLAIEVNKQKYIQEHKESTLRIEDLQKWAKRKRCIYANKTRKKRYKTA